MILRFVTMLLQVSFVGLSLGLCRLSTGTAWGIFGECVACYCFERLEVDPHQPLCHTTQVGGNLAPQDVSNRNMK